MKVVKKIWGEEHWKINNDLYCFKELYLNKGFRCSMHKHKVKDETFIVQVGKVLMEHNGSIYTMEVGDQVRIKPNELHRFSGIEDSVIYEISTTHMEEDSYRTEESGTFNNNIEGEK